MDGAFFHQLNGCDNTTLDLWPFIGSQCKKRFAASSSSGDGVN
jgi:hypothetical protein